MTINQSIITYSNVRAAGRVTQPSGGTSRRRSDAPDVPGLIMFGIFLILLGWIFSITPNLTDEVINFFKDIRLTEVSPNIFLPLPQSNHPVLYNAVYQFSLAFAAAHVFLLIARIVLRSPIDKIGSAVSGGVFWGGLAYIASRIAGGLDWVPAITLFLIVIGVGIIIGGIFSYAVKRIRR